jgi:hypothetical protein
MAEAGEVARVLRAARFIDGDDWRGFTQSPDFLVLTDGTGEVRIKPCDGLFDAEGRPRLPRISGLLHALQLAGYAVHGGVNNLNNLNDLAKGRSLVVEDA